MSNFSDFIGVYPVVKTLRFELRPVGKTGEWIKRNGVIEADEQVAENALVAKELIDKYHKICIKESLEGANYNWEELKDVCIAYMAKKTQETNAALRKKQTELRKEIAKKLSCHPLYKNLNAVTPNNLFFKSELPDFKENPVIEAFKDFTTYFEDFNTNRRNLYTNQKQTTSVAYRLVHDNFFTFVSNLKVYETIKAHCPHIIDQTTEELKAYLEGKTLDMVFSSDCSFYNNLLTQEGIDFYNRIIGGVSEKDKRKHKGINEFVNEFLQQQGDTEIRKKIVTMKVLHKQILSDRETLSYIPPVIENDNHLVEIIEGFVSRVTDSLSQDKCTIKLIEHVKQIDKFNSEGIYIAGKYINEISKKIYNDWNYIEKKLNNGKSKNQTAYSLAQIGITGDVLLSSFFQKSKRKNKSLRASNNNKGIDKLTEEIQACWTKFQKIKGKSSFKNNSKSTDVVKNLLDSLKAVIYQTSIFCVDNNDADINFYYTFSLLYEEYRAINSLYDRVQAYLTGKPQETKLKLNFGTPTLAKGFSLRKKNNEPQYNVVLFFRNGLSYLGILKDKNKPKLAKTRNAAGDSYRRLVIHFSEDKQQNTHKFNYTNIAVEQVDEWVENGQLYLFQIYNKDYAAGAKGKKNLHTLYWESLFFSEENMNNPTIKINGMAKLFYRYPQIKKKVTHKAGSKMLNRLTKEGKPIPKAIYQKLYQYFNNKNVAELTEEEKSYLDKVVVKEAKYDISKDRRYMQEKYLFHIPITFNANADKKDIDAINENVQNFLNGNPDVNIIGIDRGERNLIYLTLINQRGEILKQKTFNTVNKYDYHEKLVQREKERDEAQRNWESIGKIKDLKEGFLSAVIHEISVMMVENNAIVVLEDLNMGFKRSRIKFERQVYQKFEKMLIDKLNYLCFKDCKTNEEGGILRGYQLTPECKSFKELNEYNQSGFLFYIPAAYTSKIDPVTGFVNLFKFKSESETTIGDCKEFLGKMKRIKMRDGHFEFEFDYRNFDTYPKDYKNKWIVSTRGKRIDRKGEYRYPTEEIIKAFKEKNENISFTEGTDIKALLSDMSDNSIYRKVFEAFRLTVQMRNSNQEEDFIISPVADKNGRYFCSIDEANKGKDADENWLAKLPVDADANGAYHIALKGLYALRMIKKQGKPSKKIKRIANLEWFKFMVEKPFLQG